MSADLKTPRVEACIAAVMNRFPSDKSTAYFTEVHQHLAPLARDLEIENAALRAENQRLWVAQASAAPAVWEPQFDAISDAQEQLVIKFCCEIAGPRGQPASPPDPVRLLEMCQELYLAERDCAVVGRLAATESSPPAAALPCPACGVDRARQLCNREFGQACPMTGIAQSNKGE